MTISIFLFELSDYSSILHITIQDLILLIGNQISKSLVEFVIKFILLHEISCTSCRIRFQWGHDGLSFTTNVYINLELFFSGLTTILVLSGRPAITLVLDPWWSSCLARSVALVHAISSDTTLSSAFIWVESVFIWSFLHVNFFLGHVHLWILGLSHRVRMQEFPFILKHAFLLSMSCSHCTIL